MKKILFTTALAVIALTACTKSEPLDLPQSRAIGFGDPVLTRASTTLNVGQFNVVAFRGPVGATLVPAFTHVFTDQYSLANATDKYKKTGGADPTLWTGMYYYDGVHDYAFYGYAKTNQTTLAAPGNLAFVAEPEGVVATVGATPAGCKIVFTAGNDNQIDLVTMATGKVLLSGGQAANQAVVFKHALARVRFTAWTTVADVANNPIVITSIVLKAPLSKGEVTYANFGMDPGEETMTDCAAPAITYTLPLEAPAVTVFPILGETATTPATTSGEVFYLVPQTLSGADNLVVNYTVGGVAAPAKKFSLTNTLASGKSYNFNLKIDLNGITFNASLEDWTTPETDTNL